MKRIVAVVAVLGLAVGACGSDDDSSDATVEETVDTPDTTVDETVDPPDTTDASSDGGASVADTAEPTDEAEEGPDDGGASTDGGGSDSAVDADPIRSIEDIPEVCRDGMVDFLSDIEPLVSDIDWDTATFADFETLAADFETASAEFAQQNLAAGCDQLEFVEDQQLELLIEFAEDEAPGTVGFLQFLGEINGAMGGESGNGSASDTGFADCDEAIEFVQGLMDDYDSFADVPATELVKLSGIAAIFTECSPDQLEFFDSPEVNDFLS